MPDVFAAERPATFREVVGCPGYRAVFIASTLSCLGDYAARAAVTALVFQRTGSVAASAATFAISYLPWLGIGSMLAAVAERHSYRRVMILCDLVRLVVMAAIALPGLPVAPVVGLLFVTALLNPPFEAARSALLPTLLKGDRYVVAIAAQNSSFQAMQIVGYAIGASLAAFEPRIAVLLNAATFGVSALVVTFGVRETRSTPARRRAGLIKETADGFGVVFGARVPRAIAVASFALVFFAILPEGLAAGWAAHLTDSASGRGLNQGLIMVANPIGYILGSIVVGRFVSPSRKVALIRPFMVLAPLALIPALTDPGIAAVVAMTLGCGFFVAGMFPVCNGLFVQLVPDGFRARAFSVVLSGVQIVQAAGVFLGGYLAEVLPVPLVVGAGGAIGGLILTVIALRFPNRRDITTAIDRASASQAGAPAPETGTTGRPADVNGMPAAVTGKPGAVNGKPAGPAGPRRGVGCPDDPAAFANPAGSGRQPRARHTPQRQPAPATGPPAPPGQ